LSSFRIESRSGFVGSVVGDAGCTVVVDAESGDGDDEDGERVRGDGEVEDGGADGDGEDGRVVAAPDEKAAAEDLEAPTGFLRAPRTAVWM
jgi:hypothetical protein